MLPLSQNRDIIIGYIRETIMSLWGKLAKLFHGSIHDFSEFKKLPKEEGWGAQHYGQGSYLAGNPETAIESYAKTLANRAEYESTKDRAKAQKLNREREDKELLRLLRERITQDFPGIHPSVRSSAVESLHPNTRASSMDELVSRTQDLSLGDFSQYWGRGSPESYLPIANQISQLTKSVQPGSPEHISILNFIKAKDGHEKNLLELAKKEAKRLSPLRSINERASEYQKLRPLDLPPLVEVPNRTAPKAKGRLYEVNLNSASEDIIPLDMPFDLLTPDMLDRLRPVISTLDGSSPLQAMRNRGMTPELSEHLRSQGLKGGMYYPDTWSQVGSGKPQQQLVNRYHNFLENKDYSPFNFVVYDPSDLEIVKKTLLGR